MKAFRPCGGLSSVTLASLLFVLSTALSASGAKSDFQYLEIGYGFRPVIYDLSPRSACAQNVKDRCTDAIQVSSEQYRGILEKLDSNSSYLLSDVRVMAPIYSCLREGEKSLDSLEEGYKQDKEAISQRCAVRLTSLKSKFAGKLDQDVPLKNACENEARTLCRSRQNKISCLKSKIGDKKMGAACRKEVHRRKVEESEDIRFNKYLFSVCSLDREQFCKNVPFGQGRMTTCLEKFYGKLQAECKSSVKQVIIDKQKDSTLDVRFRLLCKEDAQNICPVEFQVIEDPFEVNHGGKLKKCMRNATLAGDVRSPECKEHMLFMMEQTRKYTELDPYLVEACQ